MELSPIVYVFAGLQIVLSLASTVIAYWQYIQVKTLFDDADSNQVDFTDKEPCDCEDCDCQD